MRERWLDAEPAPARLDRLPAQDPLAAAAEIRRVADDRPLRPRRSLCGGSERPYGEPRYLPIFEAADECGLPVAIHSAARAWASPRPPAAPALPTFYIEWHTLGSAGSIMAHLVSLVCYGVFERFPTLKVLLLEGGVAWLPGHPLAAGHELARRCAPTRPGSTRKPSEVAREHVRFTTQPLEHTDGHDELLFEMLDAAGAPGDPVLRVRLSALGLRRPRVHAPRACPRLARSR